MKSFLIYNNTRWLKTLFARNMTWQKKKPKPTETNQKPKPNQHHLISHLKGC